MSSEVGLQVNDMRAKYAAIARQQIADLPLKFDRPVLIVGGSEVDADHLSDMAARGYAVIAADGGAANCAAAGIVPEAIIGDMDSLQDAAQWAEKSTLFQIDEQETTDFEKCVYCIEAPLFIVFGVSGGRLDHSLAALNVVARYAHVQPFLLVDRVDVALSCVTDINLNIGAGDRISIYPLAPIVFASSSGLTYPLDGLHMAPDARVGTSNSAAKAQVQIRVEKMSSAPYLVLTHRNNFDHLRAAAMIQSDG